MNIEAQIQKFLRKHHRTKIYSQIYKSVLAGGKAYSMNAQEDYAESDYLPQTIRESVKAYSSNKDTVIALYKDLLQFLEKEQVSLPQIDFPPIPVSNTFERLMFIAKYLQDDSHKISDLTDLLWVSQRTVEEDLRRLRGFDNPIQVCGRTFSIPDTERSDGRLRFESTAHPFFLTENLTQVLVLLKGQKAMAENPLYASYARETAKEIWDQLSPYARDRIRFVLGELMPEDLSWYESLENKDARSFRTEKACAYVHNEPGGVILTSLKNERPFLVEYRDEDGIHLYSGCLIERMSFRDDPEDDKKWVIVKSSGGRKKLFYDRILRAAFTTEELAAN